MTKYVVAGSHKVFGHEPGTEFEADLTEFDEARLIKGGALAKAKKTTKGRNGSQKEES